MNKFHLLPNDKKMNHFKILLLLSLISNRFTLKHKRSPTHCSTEILWRPGKILQFSCNTNRISLSPHRRNRSGVAVRRSEDLIRTFVFGVLFAPSLIFRQLGDNFPLPGKSEWDGISAGKDDLCFGLLERATRVSFLSLTVICWENNR